MVTITQHPATHHKIFPASGTIPDDNDSPQGSVEVGDLWPDTSSGLTYKACTSISPITFTSIGGSSFAASDISGQTEQPTPGSGDFLVIYDAGEAALRKVDWGNLPGAGGGISNVLEDTTPQLGGDLDTNTFDIQFDDAKGIRDDSDNEQLIFQKSASAVNHLEVTNAATGNDPQLAAVGDDTDVDLLLAGQGSGVPKIGASPVATDASISTHAAVATAHHTKYTDAEAIAAVEGEATLALTGDVTVAAGKSLSADTISEQTGAAGVTIDGVLVKDGEVDGVDVSVHDANSDAHHAQLHAAAHADGGADELALQDLASDAATDGQVAKADGSGGVAFEDDDFGINFIIDGGGSAITTGVKGYLEMPFAGVIESNRVFADQSGSIVIDIWKDTYANFPPTNADSITASAPPTLTTADKSEDASLTGWTTTFAAGDVLGFNVDSITTVERVTLSLRGRKT